MPIQTNSAHYDKTNFVTIGWSVPRLRRIRSVIGQRARYHKCHEFQDSQQKREIRYAWAAGEPVVTTAIIVACVAVWLVEIVARYLMPPVFAAIVNWGHGRSGSLVQRPWTWLTSMFLHAPSVLHILFNMLALWSVGPMLERMLGHWRFLAFYLISGFWRSRGLDGMGSPDRRLGTAAYGASGALFGLFAAMLVVFRRVGADIRSMLVWMAVNFAMPFVIGGIAWQAHVGGFVTGGVLAALLTAAVPGTLGSLADLAHGRIRWLPSWWCWWPWCYCARRRVCCDRFDWWQGAAYLI